MGAASGQTQVDDERDLATHELERLVGRELLGRYRLDELLRVGGTGAVYRAHQLTLKRDVAVKILHPELTRNDSAESRVRVAPDMVDAWLALVEGSDAEALVAALAAHHVENGAVLYRLIHLIHADDL